MYLQIKSVSSKGSRACELVLRDARNPSDSELKDELGLLRRKLVEKFIGNMNFEEKEDGFTVDFDKVNGTVIKKSKELVKYMMGTYEAMLGADYELEVKQ